MKAHLRPTNFTYGFYLGDLASRLFCQFQELFIIIDKLWPLQAYIAYCVAQSMAKGRPCCVSFSRDPTATCWNMANSGTGALLKMYLSIPPGIFLLGKNSMEIHGQVLLWGTETRHTDWMKYWSSSSRRIKERKIVYCRMKAGFFWPSPLILYSFTECQPACTRRVVDFLDFHRYLGHVSVSLSGCHGDASGQRNSHVML